MARWNSNSANYLFPSSSSSKKLDGSASEKKDLHFYIGYEVGEIVWRDPDVRKGTLYRSGGREPINVHCHMVPKYWEEKAMSWYRTVIRINHPRFLKVYWINDESNIIFTEISTQFLNNWLDLNHVLHRREFEYLNATLADILKKLLEAIYFIRTHSHLMTFAHINLQTIFLRNGEPKLTWISDIWNSNDKELRTNNVECFIKVIDAIWKKKNVVRLPSALACLIQDFEKEDNRKDNNVLKGATYHPAFMNADTRLRYRQAIYTELKNYSMFSDICDDVDAYYVEKYGSHVDWINRIGNLITIQPGQVRITDREIKNDWRRNRYGHVIYMVFMHKKNGVLKSYCNKAISFARFGRNVNEHKIYWVNGEVVEKELNLVMPDYLYVIHLHLSKARLFITPSPDHRETLNK